MIGRWLQAAVLLMGLAISAGVASSQMKDATMADASRVTYHTTQVDGLKIFYREAGPKDAPAVVLLHGFPSSSHMFRELIPRLSDKYHVLAPDYPGYGYSDAPSPERYAYTFDHLADTVDHFLDQQSIMKYSIYIQDYGSPVGFRLATRHPERIQAIITQNGNAYDEGLSPFWAEFLYPYWRDPNPTNEAKVRQLLTLDATKLQYLQGFRTPEHVPVRPGGARPARQRQDPTRSFLRLPQQPATLSRVAQVLAGEEAGSVGCLGQERSSICPGGRGGVLEGYAWSGIAFARHRTLRSGRGWSGNCAAHPRVYGKERPLSAPEVV